MIIMCLIAVEREKIGICSCWHTLPLTLLCRAFRIAYYKVHYPEAFYIAYYTVRADDFDASVMARGKNAFVKKCVQSTQRKRTERLLRKKKTLYRYLKFVLKCTQEELISCLSICTNHTRPISDRLRAVFFLRFPHFRDLAKKRCDKHYGRKERTANLEMSKI